MRIAVNTRFLFKDALEGVGVYTHELLKRMVTAHSADSFDFYFDRPPSDVFKYSGNVAHHWLHPQARHPWLFYVWYQHRLRGTLERLQPDVFWSPDSFTPLNLSVPSVVTIHDLAYARYPEHLSSSSLRYYSKNMIRFANEASQIITVSEFSKREICDILNVDSGKVSVIYNGVSGRFKPISDVQKRSMREKYADGHDYFLYVGAIHPRKNIVNLIKAYQLFRSTAGDKIKLIVAGRNAWKFKEVVQLAESSSFRDDIVLAGFVPDSDLPMLVGAATAMTYVSLYEGFGLPVAEAMSSGVPVIVSDESSTGGVLHEVAGEAGFSCDPLDPESIAQAMHLVVTDSGLKHTHIERGIIRSRTFDWDKAAQQTYDQLQAQVSF